jgi:hypothetical protein
MKTKEIIYNDRIETITYKGNKKAKLNVVSKDGTKKAEFSFIKGKPVLVWEIQIIKNEIFVTTLAGTRKVV